MWPVITEPEGSHDPDACRVSLPESRSGKAGLRLPYNVIEGWYRESSETSPYVLTGRTPIDAVCIHISNCRPIVLPGSNDKIQVDPWLGTVMEMGGMDAIATFHDLLVTMIPNEALRLLESAGQQPGGASIAWMSGDYIDPYNREWRFIEFSPEAPEPSDANKQNAHAGKPRDCAWPDRRLLHRAPPSSSAKTERTVFASLLLLFQRCQQRASLWTNLSSSPPRSGHALTSEFMNRLVR